MVNQFVEISLLLLLTRFATAILLKKCPALPAFVPPTDVDLVFVGAIEDSNKPFNDSFNVEGECFYDTQNDFQALVKFQTPEAWAPLRVYRRDSITIVTSCSEGDSGFEVTAIELYEKPKGPGKVPDSLKKTTVLEDFVLDVLQAPLNGVRFTFRGAALLCPGGNFEGTSDIPSQERKKIPEIYLWVLLGGFLFTIFAMFLVSKCSNTNRGGGVQE